MPRSSHCRATAASLIVQRAIHALPADFGILREEARSQGYRFLDRLAEDWADGTLRFNGPHEVLLAACLDGALVAIGGLTAERDLPGALRLRRFYVRADRRRQGIGRKLAAALLDHAARAESTVTVNAGTKEAPPFWEALGFQAVRGESYTHVLNRRS